MFITRYLKQVAKKRQPKHYAVSNNKKGSKTFKELEPKFITQFPFACFQFQ